MDIIKKPFEFLTHKNGFSPMNCIFEGNIDVAFEMHHKKVTLTCHYDKTTKEFWCVLIYPNSFKPNLERMEVNLVYVAEAITLKHSKCCSSDLKSQVKFNVQILKEHIGFILSPNFSIIRNAVKLQDKQFELRNSALINSI